MSKTVSQEEIVSHPQSDVPSLGQGDKAGKPNDDIKYIETIASSPEVGWGQLIDEDLVRAENEDKITPYFIFLVSIAAIAGLLFGYDTAIIGAALPMVHSDLGHALSNSEQEIITAGCTIGAIFGALILGNLADKIGRRGTMAISDIAFTIGAIILASSFSVPQMIVGRLILGVGVGGASVIAPLYISELAPTAIRGRCIGVNCVCIPLGQVLASALGAGFQAGVKPHIAWRVLFALGAVPSVVQMALLHYLPESPRVLILRGDHEAARNVYNIIYRDASPQIIEFKLQVCRQYVEATTRLQREFSFWQRAAKYWTHKPYRRAITSVSVIQAAGQLTGFNTLLYYSGTIFGLLGLKNPAAGGLIPSGTVTIVVAIGSSLVDRVGRRRSLLIGIPLMMIGLAWICVSFHYLTLPTNGALLPDYQYPTALVGSVLGAIIIFVIGVGYSYGYICWFQSEFLALEIRAAGSSIASASCWLANLVVSICFLTQLESLGASGTYGLYLGFVTIGGVFVIFCYPESRGLSIDETSSLFLDGYGVKRAQLMLKEKRRFAKELSAGGNMLQPDRREDSSSV